MKKRIFIILLVAVELLSSCGVFRFRNSPMYLAGEPTDGSGYMPVGTVVEDYYPCSVKGPTHRRMIVYLPPEYEESDARYPVVYLLHGARGYETAWIRKGRMLQVTDSVYTHDLGVPAIVVMPNVNQYNDSRDYENSRYKDALESLFEIDGTVERAFLNDVVGFVDSHYRTIPDKAHRAICGLSVGGLQSAHISANYPQTFDYIGLFSPFWKVIQLPGPDNDFYHHFKQKLAEQFVPDPPKGYYIMIGKTDVFYPHVKNLRRYLDKMGYPYTYIEAEGGHEWYNWTPFYVYLLENAFREEPEK